MAAPPFALDMSLQGRFFDRAEVLKQISQIERRALSRMGAFIQRRAKTDVLRRTRPYGPKKKPTRDASGRFQAVDVPAVPGQPPIVRAKGYASLRRIIFALGPDNQSVLVGPVRFKPLTRSNRKTVPELLEFGGSAKVTETVYPDGRVYRGVSKFRGRGETVRNRNANYKPFPFMSVALEREAAAGTLLDAFSMGVSAG
jgi:hypothetical protein